MQGINSFYMVLQVIFGGVGAIALLVAAIGIANTMAMAILERTREIGLMKAIGATNRDVLSVFLGEAAGIGFIGGLGGVVLGWSAGQVLNVLALAYLAGQTAQTGGLPPSVAVYTPTWLPVFALVFATLIGLISGLYPALRAATLIPVNASEIRMTKYDSSRTDFIRAELCLSIPHLPLTPPPNWGKAYRERPRNGGLCGCFAPA